MATNLKTIAKAAAITTGKVVLPVVFGIIFNWLFAVIFLFKWIASGFENWIYALIGFVVLIAVFPVIYFIRAKLNAVKHALRFLYDNSTDITHGIVDNAVGYMLGIQDNKGITGAAVQTIKERVNKGGIDMPRGINRITNFLLQRLPLVEVMNQVREKFDMTMENKDQISAFMKQRIDQIVRERYLDTGSAWLLLLFLLNLTLIVLAWIYIF